jgi:hypothetical protein
MVTFTSEKVVYYFEKMGWAAFWAIFSQTRLVTLQASNKN